jgi:hypothetical protein
MNERLIEIPEGFDLLEVFPGELRRGGDLRPATLFIPELADLLLLLL